MSRQTDTTSDRTAQKQHSDKTLSRRRILQATGAVAVAGISTHTAAAQTAGPDTMATILDGGVFSSPTIVNGNVYIGSGGGTVYGLDDGLDENWSVSTDGDGIVSSPTVANGTVYIGSRQSNITGKLHAIDAATGNKKWAFDTDDWVDSSPTVSNSVVTLLSRTASSMLWMPIQERHSG